MWDNLVFMFVRTFMTIVIICSTFTAQAGDRHFESIQPFDDYVKEKLMWDDTGLAATISDYSQYTMILAPFAVQLDEDRVLMRLGGVAAAHLSVSALTHVVKRTAKRVRPNGSGTESFFSGHTSASFVGAGVVCRDEPTLCPVSILLASTAGYMRIAANRHWASDVIAGAWFGYAGGQLIPTLVLRF